MRKTITISTIEPAPLSFRHPLGVNLDLMLTVKTLTGGPDPNYPFNSPQLVLMPRSKGGVYPYDMTVYDAGASIIRAQVPGSSLTDRSGYNLELYVRDHPGDPPVPYALAARGVIAMEGATYASPGPLSMINVPVIVGPPGPPGPAGVGVQGDPGVDGERGSMWFTGLGDPTLTGDFIVGDMYLDQSNGNVWRWEGAGAWVQQ